MGSSSLARFVISTARDAAGRKDSSELSEMAAEDIDHYHVLGVSPRATREEIRKAYLAKARSHHPDVTGEDTTRREMRRINDAFRVLSNAELRRQYDRERKSRARPPEPEVPRVAQLTLPITPEESRYGGRIAADVVLPCQCNCGANLECPHCHGRGWWQQRLPISLLLPPGCRSGTRLRVSLHGAPRRRSISEIVLTIRVDPNRQ